LGGVALGGAYYYMNSGAVTPHPLKEEGKTPKSTSELAKVAFMGGEQGFLSLPLESIETINHNTKKFRFSLPEADMESGLRVACKLAVRRPDLM
jgi:cytochrome-b5 reductase